MLLCLHAMARQPWLVIFWGDVVPDRPFCNIQAPLYDPDKSDRPLRNKVASRGKKVRPKRYVSI